MKCFNARTTDKFLTTYCKKTGCRFVSGEDLTGALHVLQLQLLPPPQSALAPIKSRMETLWYWIIQMYGGGLV